MNPNRYKTSHEAALAEWLEDDVAPKLSYAAADPQAITAAAQPAKPKEKTTVQIDIRLPKLKLGSTGGKLRVASQYVAQLKHLRIPRKHILAAFATVAVIAIAGSVGKGLMTSKAAPSEQISAAGGSSAATGTSKPALTKPSFAVLAPKDKAQLGQVGNSSTAYDGTRNTFSFMDTMQGTQITVSEQPIPADMGGPDDAATKVAKTVHATEPIATTNGKAFMATDSKANSQVIVYSVDDLLIFVQSPFKKDALAWKTYLDQLQ